MSQPSNAGHDMQNFFETGKLTKKVNKKAKPFFEKLQNGEIEDEDLDFDLQTNADLCAEWYKEEDAKIAQDLKRQDEDDSDSADESGDDD